MMYPSRSIHRGFDSLAGLNEATSTTKDNSVPRYQRAISHLSHSRVAANFRACMPCQLIIYISGTAE